MGNCASRVGADTAEGLALDGFYKPHLQPAAKSHQAHLFGVYANHHHHQHHPQQQDLPVLVLDTNQLRDEVLCALLSELPLHHLVQLSCCSSRLHQLVCKSGRCLNTVELQKVAPRLLAPALNFLAQHPAAHAIRTAVLPGNLEAATAAVLAAATGLQQLQLYTAHLQPQQLRRCASEGTKHGKPQPRGGLFHLRNFQHKQQWQQQYSCQAQPDTCCLNLQQLSRLTSLDLALHPGDINPGRTLDLPQGLKTLNLCADSFSAAINPLDMTQLKNLGTLNIHALNNSSSGGSIDCLSKLTQLPNLRHLSVGRFNRVPAVLHSFSGLASLRVEVRGKVVQQKGAGGSQHVLTAAATAAKVAVTGSGCGLLALPARPNLQLQIQMTVPSPADSLSEDWSCLANLRHLTLVDINPIGSRGFDLNPLTELGRLRSLSLGFKGQQKVTGQGQTLELHGLPQIIQLKALSVTSSGPGVHLNLEAPRHLTSLTVACQARLTLAVPGSTAAAAAQRAAAVVAAAAAAARVGCDYSSYDNSYNSVCNSYWDSSAASFGSNGSSGFGHLSSHTNGYVTFPMSAGKQQQQQPLPPQQQQQPLPKNQGLLSGGLATAYCPSSHSPPAAAAAAAAGGYDTAAMYDQQLQQQLVDLLNGVVGACGGGGDATAAVLMMQRHLDRLGSIGETEEAYNTDDEAEQLSHTVLLGLMAGGGICIRDHLITSSNCAGTADGAAGAGGAAAGKDRKHSGSGSRRGSSFVRTLSSNRGGQRQGVWPLDDWLAAKGISLQDLHLVELTPAAAAAAAGHFVRKCGSSNGSGKLARLVVRRGMEDDFVANLCSWGFV